MTVRHRIIGLCMAIAGAMTVVGCGSDGFATVAVTHFRSTTAMNMPNKTDDHGVPLPLVVWGRPDQLVLVTWGSGSYPSLPTAVTLQNAHHITIDLGSTDGSASTGCTADLTPTNSVITAPPGLDATTPAIAEIQGDQVTIPARDR